MEHENHIGAVILAAGESSRMNSPKALLLYERDYTFLERILDTYSEWGCDEIVVVVNQETNGMMSKLKSIPPIVSVIVNEHPEYERFYSVKLGLGQLIKSQYCFIQNVDNPFIDGTILDILYENRSPDTFVSPVFENKGGHPVLLNRENMQFIRNYPSDTANLKETLNKMDCKKVDMHDKRVLININTPADYDRIFNL